VFSPLSKVQHDLFPARASKEMVCPVEAGRVKTGALSPTVRGVMEFLHTFALRVSSLFSVLLPLYRGPAPAQ
jgi:hypothetical protein